MLLVLNNQLYGYLKLFTNSNINGRKWESTILYDDKNKLNKIRATKSTANIARTTNVAKLCDLREGWIDLIKDNGCKKSGFVYIEIFCAAYLFHVVVAYTCMDQLVMAVGLTVDYVIHVTHGIADPIQNKIVSGIHIYDKDNDKSDDDYGERITVAMNDNYDMAI